MSGEAVADQVVDKLVRTRTAFNNLLRTRYEIDAKKLSKQVESGEAVETGWPWGHDVDDLETPVVELVRARYDGAERIQVREISIGYWCSVPKDLDKKFAQDVALQSKLQRGLEALHGKFVQDVADAIVSCEQICDEAPEYEKQIKNAQDLFDRNLAKLKDQCETDCTDLIVAELTATVKALGNYKRYKIKAGAKLIVTVTCVVAATVGLATAATPAAPATLIPALAGISVGLLSIGRQCYDLVLTVDECEEEIRENLNNWKVEYFDPMDLVVPIDPATGQPRIDPDTNEPMKPKKPGLKVKTTFKIREFTLGALGGLTGGASEVVFPTLSGTLDLIDLHARKVDGLVGKFHRYGVRLGKGLDELQEILALDRTVLAATWREKLQQVDALKADMEKLVTQIPELDRRIEDGRKKNQQYGEGLRKIEKALGSKHYAEVGQLLASLALVASGGAGIGTSLASEEGLKTLEAVTSSIAMATAGLDALKDHVG